MMVGPDFSKYYINVWNDWDIWFHHEPHTLKEMAEYDKYLLENRNPVKWKVEKTFEKSEYICGCGCKDIQSKEKK